MQAIVPSGLRAPGNPPFGRATATGTLGDNPFHRGTSEAWEELASRHLRGFAPSGGGSSTPAPGSFECKDGFAQVLRNIELEPHSVCTGSLGGAAFVAFVPNDGMAPIVRG
jgi:hypothetical protein